MLEGRLYYRSDLGRYGLMSHGEWIIDGFHCGQTMEVYYGTSWVPTRLEFADDWYLVGLPGVVPYDLKARLKEW